MANGTMPASLPAERRYLTSIFIDLVGYTALSEQLDPEDLRLLQRRYQNLALTVMERFGGFVSQFQGDGVVVYFGYPVAHENDAERAVRAALEFLHRLQNLDTNVRDGSDFPLTARIGIHTGLVQPAFRLRRLRAARSSVRRRRSLSKVGLHSKTWVLEPSRVFRAKSVSTRSSRRFKRAPVPVAHFHSA
jgi:hypothetical protein